MTEITLTVPDWPALVWVALAYGIGFVVTFMIGARNFDLDRYRGNEPEVFLAALMWPGVGLFLGLWKLARIGKGRKA